MVGSPTDVTQTARGLPVDTGKMFIGALVLIGAFVAMAWFGWFGPITKNFQQIKSKAVTPNNNYRR